MAESQVENVNGRHRMVMAKSTRAADLDAIRLIGIAAVVLGHVWTAGPFTDALFAWHVPVFFVLTGYLWKTGRSVRDEISRRTKTLLVPYAAWLLILGVLFAAVDYLRNGALPLEALRNAAYGGAFAVRPFSAFWFVTVLFSTAVLCRMLERFPSWVPWAIAAIGLVACIFAGTVMAKTPLGVALAVPCLTFVLVGQSLPLIVARIRYRVLVGLGLVTVGVAAAALRILQPLNLKDGDFGTPVLSVANASAISLGLILVFASLYHSANEVVNKITIQLASAGLVVVLTHAFFLYLLNTPPIGTILDAAVALMLPFVLAVVVARSPLRRWLIG